jgi:hypothetical protein
MPILAPSRLGSWAFSPRALSRGGDRQRSLSRRREQQTADRGFVLVLRRRDLEFARHSVSGRVAGHRSVRVLAPIMARMQSSALRCLFRNWSTASLPLWAIVRRRSTLQEEDTCLLYVEAMPIRDAVDLARFLVQTTIGFAKLSVARPKTVGGSIAIAAITKHEGFQWVQRQKGFGTSRI